MDEHLYEQRMLGYYPRVISSLLEFQAIINGEAPEFHTLDAEQNMTLANAYLLTMQEPRIAEWEQALGIKPLSTSTVDQRRDTVIARIRGQGKLNTTLINSIVNAFTGGIAESWVENSCLYVVITPPPDNKSFQFEDVKQELKKKVPAHLGISIQRNYFTWNDILNASNDRQRTWGDVNTEFDDWNAVYLYVPDWQNAI